MTAELELTSSPRILAGTRADVQVTVYRDGKAATPSGTLTFSAADADGTVVASGTPTTPTGTTGVLSAVLTAAQLTSVNDLTITWGGLVFDSEPAVSLTSHVEVVSAFLFTEPEARAFDGGTLKEVTAFPSAAILQARDAITEAFEDILGYRLGLQFVREIRDGDGTDTIYLRETKHVWSLRAASIRTTGSSTWTALTSGQLALTFVGGNGRVTREDGNVWTAGKDNIRLSYEAGATPIPRELKRAALLVAAQQLPAYNGSRRTTTMSNEDGTFILATPGIRGSYFGIPEADEVLHRLSRKLPVFA